MKNWNKRFIFFMLAVLVPQLSHAQVVNFVFISDSQTIGHGVVSQQMTLQAQDSGGVSVNIPQTACLSLNTTSSQGQFSSSGTTWTPVTVLTMNKGTANKNFFYKDTQDGTQALTVKVALKPTDVSSSCASWPVEQWNMQWNAVQNITIGASSGSSDSSTSTSTTQTQAQTSSTAAANANTIVSSYVAPPSAEVFADGGADRTVITGADTEFRGRAYNRSQDIVENVRFNWNFGDGSTAEGAAVMHHFDYPGRYAVVLTIAQNISAASDKIIVTAEPAKIAFTVNPDASVSITNNAGRDIDISHWIIKSFGRTFLFPDGTDILAGESLRIASARLGFATGPQTELEYPNGVRVETSTTSTESVSTPASVPSAARVVETSSPGTTVKPPSSDVLKSDFPPDSAARDMETAVKSIPLEVSAGTTSRAALTASAGAAAGGSYLWWLGVCGLMLAAFGVAFFVKRTQAGEWNIIEDDT